ncbi:MAG: MFS transporter, partial [Pseudobdellovibrionaceae bacterium]
MHKARPSNFWLILMLGALTTLTPFSIDLYLPTFAQIAEDLGTTQSRVAFSLSSYFIGMSFGQLVYGPLLDRFGRKKPLYFGLVLFVGASLGCMASPSLELLIGFRFLQALGGCGASVAALAWVRDFFARVVGAWV